MEFFSHLRKVANVLDQECDKLKENMNKPPKMRPVEGSPIHILREIQSQTQALKVNNIINIVIYVHTREEGSPILILREIQSQTGSKGK